MKKIFTSILLMSGLLAAQKVEAAPLSGTYLIPSPTYGSLAAFIDALNLNGVSGPVVARMLVNETAPSGGYVLGSSILNPTTGPGSSITITGWKSFPGPATTMQRTLYANTGTGNNDAIFSIQGTDYVTLMNFKIMDTSINTTSTTMMEKGVAIEKLNGFDGCKTPVIKNCRIILNNTNTTPANGIAGFGAAGIFVGNCTPFSNTALAPTIEDGTHDGLFISNDTIINTNYGVYYFGNPVNTDGSAFNEKNGTISQNIIENFTHTAINISNSNNDVVSKNSINNTNSGGVAPTANMLFGISYANTATQQTNTTWNCQDNNINLTINCAGSYAATGIYTRLYGNGTTTISTDTIQITSTGTSAHLNGIFSQNYLGTQVISKNLVRNFSTLSTNTQPVIGIYTGGYSTYSNFVSWTTAMYPYTSTVDGNVITDFNVASSTIGGALTCVFGCQDDNLASNINSSFTNNTVKNFVISANSTACYGYGGIYRISGATLRTTNITGNTFTNLNAAAATTTPISVIRPTGPYPGSHTVNCSLNKINNINSALGQVAAYIFDDGLTTTVSKDTVSNLTSSNGSAVGILAGSSTAGYATKNFILDKLSIKNLTSNNPAGGTVVAGVYIIPGTYAYTSSVVLSNSVLNNFVNTDTAGTAYGFVSTAGNFACNIQNNMISDIIAAADTALYYSSSFGIYSNSTGAVNLWYNTINMNTSAAGGKSYGATGIRYNPSGTNAVQNNIVRNNVLAGVLNNSTAVRSSFGIQNSAPSVTGFTAASNIYYTPTGSNNYLYVEGNDNSTLVNGYSVSGLTANSTKNIVNDTFFNSECNKSSYHKFMQLSSATRELKTFTENNLTGAAGIYTPTGMSYAESMATDIVLTNDMALNPRPFGSSDIGALEFAGSVRPSMNISIASTTGYDTACTFNLPMLVGTIPAFFNRVSYQWYRDTTKIIGATSNTLMVTSVSGNYILNVYDSVTGCTYPSTPFRMTIVPPPVAFITYYDSLTFCESSSVVLHANTGYKFIYQWYRNGVLLPGETNDHYVASKSGDYTVEVNTPLGCSTVSKSIRVKVYPLPTPVVIYGGPRVLSTQKYYTYQWYWNNIKIDSFAQSRNYYVFKDGAYSVEVTDSNGCTAKSEVYLYSLGVNDPSLAAAIKVFPNPATDRIAIESPIAIHAKLTDMIGRTLYEENNAKEVPLGQFADGMYLLTLADKDGNLIKVEKISKTKY